ncbi:hypothetical protein CROQUDRAFT_96115 [Cronartium quercuum f. sp. fusiforme G11]|uniref:HECT-type E3 ubiquitin transferase n=1 Tax=Cronartium quercuum f. sp. fusiforme G11 TaxID=708437 RepID=A0A9P6NBK0_9BASI|nr:hypothetical protein CROQUDRAFT_96115 [Cronartium quercuum f. sp. fusiforme G11]
MYSFTGSSRNRPLINLGGQSVNKNSTELMRQAKDDRIRRDIIKRQLNAVSIIQAFWRSRRVAYQTKVKFRSDFDQIIKSLNHNHLSYQLQLKLSRLLLILFTPSETSDHQRLFQWANLIILPKSNPPYQSYIADNGELGKTWKLTILPIFIQKVLKLIATYPRSEHCLPLLQATHQIFENYDDLGILLVIRRVGQDEYWRNLRAHILAFDPIEKSSNRTVAFALTLSLLPLRLNRPQSTTPHSNEQAFSRAFATYIFTIPMLPNRLDLSALIDFSGALPLPQLLEALPQSITGTAEQAIHLLANLLTWGSKLLTTMSAISLSHYLLVIRRCVDIIPGELFERVDAHLASRLTPSANTQTLVSGTSRVVSLPAAQTTRNLATQPDVIMSFSSSSSTASTSSSEIVAAAARDQLSSLIRSINPKTLSWISTLLTSDHLAKLYSLSNKHPTSCRPVFCQTLVSVLYAWPTSREKIFNALVSSGGVNGFMRELWRLSIRGGKVGMTLRDRKAGGSPQGVLTALGDSKLCGEWEDLIVLSELYSRCLMTLGDDEFFNDETKVGQQAKGKDVVSTGRNPLLLGEVIGLAGLLRNLAFGLYWTEGQADIKQGYVIGTRVGLEQLRNLATRLLQQIYVRDSRRPFCEPGFWLMTSTFDLQSFIQTVVYEESHLEEIRDDPSNQQASSAQDFLDPDLDLLDHLPRPRSGHQARERVSKRQLAFISPRLGVLNNIPFVIPFEQRVTIFRTFVQSDRHRAGLDVFPFGKPKHKAVIRREHIAEDGFLHLNALGSRLKEPIEIKFIDQHGLEEAGIDGGGVFKEFLTNLTKLVFDSNKGLWLVNANMELYPNPHSYSRESLSLEWYAFLGRVLGKALYEGILVDVEFADFFLNKWLGKQSYLDDLASLDPELYQGLLFLKNYGGDVESDLSLNFTISSQEFGISKTIELLPNGAQIPVTTFFKGLNDIVEAKWLRMFNTVELKVLVGGLDGQDLDFDDLQRCTVYGGWDEAHETIRMFWRVVKRFDNPTKAKLLKFVTSCARPPLLGFKELRPSFAIRCAGQDESRLPSASTCVNLLKLPEYKTEIGLEEKLVYAINAGAGFDLS